MQEPIAVRDGLHIPSVQVAEPQQDVESATTALAQIVHSVAGNLTTHGERSAAWNLNNACT
jgi:hypothetical protein